MKYHPILFSTPMVQAIQENRKTQTRRTKGLEKINDKPYEWKFDTYFENQIFYFEYLFSKKKSEQFIKIKCPYNVGDVLWVRENFYTAENWDHLKPSLLKKYDINVYYKSDIGNENIPQLLHKGKMRPNIFLPAAYARTFLKIKSIRAERLQDISEEDAIAEGVEKIADYGATGYRLYTEPDAAYSDIDAIYSFESLWQSINGKDSWNKNPFVWVYEFEKIDKPEDFI